ncbi:MAG: flagellar hook capping protein [Sulfurimonas sp.]|nr:flagellar hook capping protein [Sulfurimonas sp.]
MAITSVGENAALYAEPVTNTSVEDKTALGKDDFMKLLLVQLQHQDPTEPMDSATILTQTSQLAGLEASENTNKALEELAISLGSSNQFSTIAAIGKTADLGSNAIIHDEGSSSSFEVYFPSDVQQGSVEVLNSSGEIIQTIDVGTNPSGVYQFDWDGSDSAGNIAESGMYYITASYTDPDGKALDTRLGAYPIESVRFDGGETLVKVGSNYVPLSQVKEVY